MAKNDNFDYRDALRCSEILFRGLLRGESTACFWVPGAGKSTTLKNIFSSKEILRKSLGGFFPRFKFIYFRADCPEGTANSVLRQVASYLDPNFNESDSEAVFSIKRSVSGLLVKGVEPVFVGDLLDVLSAEELKILLCALGSVVVANRNRVHSILCSIDRPTMDQIFMTDRVAFGLSQRCEYVPLVKGDLLEGYLEDQQDKYGIKLLSSEKVELTSLFSGILLFNVAYLRLKSSNPKLTVSQFLDHPQFRARLSAFWFRTPLLYREILVKIWKGENLPGQLERNYLLDLEMLGVVRKRGKNWSFGPRFLDSAILQLVEKTPLTPENLKNKLTEQEYRVFERLFQKGKVSRDEIAEAVWPEEADEKFSSWAIDQTISRLRARLLSLGYDPDVIKTIKGTGYRFEK